MLDPADVETGSEAKKKLKVARVLTGIIIGVCLAWFVVEVFFPAPFPNLAH